MYCLLGVLHFTRPRKKMISNETMVLMKKNSSVHGFICTVLCLFYSTNSHLGFVAVLHMLTVYQLLIAVMSTEDLINPEFPLILVSGRPYWSVALLPVEASCICFPTQNWQVCHAEHRVSCFF